MTRFNLKGMTPLMYTPLAQHMHHADTALQALQKTLQQLRSLDQSLRMPHGSTFAKRKQKTQDEDTDGGSFFDSSGVDKARLLQAILQYRLDTQDTLAKLLQLDHGIMQVLGVSPHHPSHMNLERMAFALGRDDLQSILHTLSTLLDTLLRIAARHQAGEKMAFQLHHKVSSEYTNRYRLIQQATQEHSVFMRCIDAVLQDVHALRELEKDAPELDHIAALRGPISQFFQAEQHGLELFHSWYAKLNHGLHLDKTLSQVLHQADLVLKRYSPNIPPLENTMERLEERAAKRRLGCFFNP